MIIVSQDKMHIFNFDNINYLEMGMDLDNNFAIEINYSNCNFYVIARYETEERAKEVLLQIVSLYSKWMGTKSEAYIVPKVYVMPEK